VALEPAAATPVRRSAAPPVRTSLVVAGASLVLVAVTAWLTERPDARERQTPIVQWFNHPPQPFAALLALVNPLLRPLALTAVVVLTLGWVLLTAGTTARRLEILRAGAVAAGLAELITQVLKRIVGQPRPTAVIPGLDVHGYPKDPWGNAYPSAHTAVVVAVVAGLWPWLTRAQRVVGILLATAVPLNRLYIGAHWPVDVLGGAAIGMLAATGSWLVADRWPIAVPIS
jgi:undecaprenyl-diphosphatase